ncbi:hypothetical protein I5M27_16645 [Adhaeribacter sp. BT258]|uniref:Uncharacterized protein n=1 Tax=Adhaeribacter terrigena TaxID=2793070 RepID=A0ABS1C5I3_9BACT|nr:hypothetical protein [Adhaeribacter terrigena]MBK0404627.1 hypothetical protein [Adhaeribacter terrigena]
MNNKIIDYRTVSYFFNNSAGFAYVALLAAVVSLFFGFRFPWLFLGTLIFGSLFLLVTTTHYGLVINLIDRTYDNYIWILGFRKHNLNSFQEIEFCFIQQSQYKYIVRSNPWNSNEFNKKTYNGYLKFSNGVKVHLTQSLKKSEVVYELKGICKDLNIPLFDATSGKREVL